MAAEQTDKSGKTNPAGRNRVKRRRARQGAVASGSVRSVSNDKGRDRKCPERKCIVTGDIVSTDSLIRFVLAPDGSVVPDLKQRLDGRGVWVTAKRSCVMEAAARGLFARGFRTNIDKPEGLPDLIDALLEKSCLNALGLARKAGKVALGQAKVEAVARHKSSGVIVHASDGALDGRRKIMNALRAVGRDGEAGVIIEFTSNQLSLALGMPNVIHAALPGGGIADAFAKNCRVLKRYREKEAPGTSAAQVNSRKDDPGNVVEFPSEGMRTE